MAQASYSNFVAGVLQALGAPVTQNNIDKLVAVGMQEGRHGTFNIMNWVLKAPGSSNYNSVGVQNYPDFATGVRMTAQGLSQSNTAAIKQNLLGNGSYASFIATMGDFYHSWGGGGINVSQAEAQKGGGRMLEGDSGGIPTAGTQPTGGTSGPNPIDNAINWALTQQGKPYKFGGSKDGSAWDCSTLTAAYLAQMGISVPSLTWSQAAMGRHVDVNQLKAGDLIFFHGTQGNLGHVALYLGGGLELEAAHTGTNVMVTNVNFGAIQEARRFTDDAVSNAAQSGSSYRNGVSDTTGVNTSPAGDINSGAGGALANASDDDVKAYIRAHYGTMAGFIDDPEIGPILMNSARQGWSTQQLTGQLEATNWWRLRNDSEHQWALKQIDSPGQAATDRQQRVSDIIQVAGQMGVTMTAAQVQALSEESLNSGWTTDQLKNQIIGNINWAGGGTQGELQSTAQQMKALGDSYFMPIDDAQARAWAIAINEGTLTEDGVKATLQAQAQSRWSFIGNATPQDYWAPVQGAIADELEVPSSQIKMSDPKWAAALEKTNPDGTVRAATIEEAREVARNDPSWVQTNKAMSQSTNTADQLLKSLTGTGLT